MTRIDEKRLDPGAGPHRGKKGAGKDIARKDVARTCCGRRRHGGGVGRGAMTEPAIVAALLREGGHGYDLRKTVAEMTDDTVRVDAGGLYRILRRMEEEGFVTSNWVEGDSGPQKREYELTTTGLELAEDWIAHLRERAQLATMLADELQAALDSRGSSG